MVLTEDDARQKWCPWSRVTDKAGDSNCSWNRLNTQGPGEFAVGSRCIASDCMAWRWRSNADADNRYGECGLVNP